MKSLFVICTALAVLQVLDVSVAYVTNETNGENEGDMKSQIEKPINTVIDEVKQTGDDLAKTETGLVKDADLETQKCLQNASDLETTDNLKAKPAPSVVTPEGTAVIQEEKVEPVPSNTEDLAFVNKANDQDKV